MKPLRMAGSILGVGGLGTVVGYGANELVRYLDEQSTPMHSREMTQVDHAENNLRGRREAWGKATVEEIALYEGIRQGLMAGEISGSEVNTLALNGALPPRVMNMLTDVHDWSSEQPYPFSDKTIAEALQGPEAQLR